MDKAREIALKTLYKIEKEGAYSNIVLNQQIKQNDKGLTEIDKGFISELVYGTVTWKLTLDEIIKKYSKLKLNKISTFVLNILRMGIYQIIFLDKVPKSASVNESVNLAKRYGHKSSANFVNAILRKIDKKDYEEFFEIKDDIQRISKTTSMPIWLVEKLLEENTINKVEEICKFSNERPKVCIRINNLKTTKEELVQKLQQKEIKIKQGILEDFLVLENIKNIENLEEFKQGLFTIQDEGAGIIPLILNPKPNENVLDACSSPGGKTTYMAELMNNKGKILAWDIYEHRVNLVKNTSKRLGVNIIETNVQDATNYNEKYKEKFDKILLDVPCLGIGVMKRKPDIKWKKKKEDIEEITKIQKEILKTCSKYLKHDGEIVYSTCSILKEENEKIIEDFIQNNKNFELVKPKIKENYFKKYIKKDRYIQVYPNELTDGFFICKLKKNRNITN